MKNRNKHHRISRRNLLAGGAAAVGISFYDAEHNPAHAQGEDASLFFYNWDTYIGENTLADFLRRTAINVKMDIFDDDFTALDVIAKGNSGYDVFVPGQEVMSKMIDEKRLLKLDKKLIPNYTNLAKEWQTTSFDPKGQYSVPYMWGTTGIGYRKNVAEKNMADMKWVLDSDRYSGRIGWQDSSSSMIQTALVYLGESIDETDKRTLRKAARLLKKQVKHVTAFGDDGQDLLLANKIDVCIEWSGDISQAKREDPNIDYAVAPNGSDLWYDSLVILKDAPRPKNAHKFINYILDARTGRDIAEYIGYATPNKAALALTSREYRNDPVKFPPASVIRKLPVTRSLGDDYDAFIEELWEDIKSS